MMAIAIASTTMTACSSDNNEPGQPSTTSPVEQTKFFACEASNGTRSTTAAVDTVFSEDDIEWFNITTREVKFKDMSSSLYNKLMAKYEDKLEFHLGENLLFEVSRFVSDIDSRIFTDLVLHYSMIGDDEAQPRYYLQDCYPLQFISDERVQANIKKNAAQWELFTNYLESKGKLRK